MISDVPSNLVLSVILWNVFNFHVFRVQAVCKGHEAGLTVWKWEENSDFSICLTLEICRILRHPEQWVTLENQNLSLQVPPEQRVTDSTNAIKLRHHGCPFQGATIPSQFFRGIFNFFFQFLNEEGCSEFFSWLDYNNLTNTARWLHKQVFIYGIMI